MRRLALTARLDGFSGALAKAASIQPSIVIVFAAPSFWRDRAAVERACAPLSGIHLVGCSTAGEISSAGPADDSCSVLALRFERGEVKVAAAPLAAMGASRAAGQSIGEALKESRLRGIFALAPGLLTDGGAFAAGLVKAVGDKVSVAGGIAADGLDFKSCFTMLNGMVFPNLAVAFGLYGDTLSMTTSAQNGWRPFGLQRRVTRAQGNVLHELDGKPAMDVYRRYLGDAAAHMPASGLIYPLMLLREDGRDTGIVRSAWGVSADGGIALAGDVPQGSLVRLMYADPDLLLKAAGEAGREAFAGKSGDSAAIVIGCVGRRRALGEDAGAEITAALKDAGDAACAGFYACGEIAGASVRNQSIAVTRIAEAT